MIGHVTCVSLGSPLDVTRQMRDTAKSRKGEWEVRTYDWEDLVKERSTKDLYGALAGWWRRPHKDGRIVRETSIKLTEKEIPRILHIFTHGQRNGTKLATIHANLEQAAESLWPTGSLEHVAMRMLAVPLLVRVFSGHKVDAPGTRWSLVEFFYSIIRFFLALCGCAIPLTRDQLKTQLVRVDDHPRSASNSNSDGDNAENRASKGKKEAAMPEVTTLEPKADKSATNAGTQTTGLGDGNVADSDSDDPLEEDVPEPGPAPFKHGGHTPEDAELIANEFQRTVDKNGIKLIIGQDYYGDEKDLKQVVGVLTAPTPKQPNVYNNSSNNAKAAKEKRLDEKAKPWTGTKEDKKKINRMVGEACGIKGNRAVFSKKRIQEWAETHLHFEDLKSGKWSLKRTEDSLNNLIAQAYPQMQLKCSVKLEPMAEGKAPRLLIADGDDGQLMALIVVKCFEDMMFHWFEARSIKHMGKRAAIKRAVTNLTKKGAKLVEGDGSAWDTTCNATIRGLVENPVLRHIMQVLVPYGVVPEQWHEEHLQCNEKKKLKLFFQKKMDKMRMTIDAIRRSGHRGTSCLNWWMNFVNWTCSIFKQPERFLDPSVRNSEDETGHNRWWNGCFEGDDSLCAMSPPMLKDDDMDKIFLGWWDRQGFNMKIIYADCRATFCGYHIACKSGEPTGFAAPEIARALVGSGVSCSSTIIQAAKDGDIKTVKDIAAAGAIARAADFAGLFPTISRKFHRYAQDIKVSRDVSDREMSMRVMGEEGYTFSDIEKAIEDQNLAITPTMEAANLEALQCAATWGELDIFTVQAWTFESIGDYESHWASLPQSWRPALD